MEGVELCLPFVKEGDEVILNTAKRLVKCCLEDKVENVKQAAELVVSKYPIVLSLSVCLKRASPFKSMLGPLKVLASVLTGFASWQGICG